MQCILPSHLTYNYKEVCQFILMSIFWDVVGIRTSALIAPNCWRKSGKSLFRIENCEDFLQQLEAKSPCPLRT